MNSSLRMTSADLLNFPDDSKRREIIDGELYVSTQPHWYHQALCARFGHFLGEWSDESGSGQVAIAPGLIFAEDDDVVPDVVWASQERLARILEGGKLYAAPELVIEVLSPGKKNIARDRETKLKLYARRDADEYWIADWPRHVIEIYRRSADTLALAATVGPGGTLTTPLLPGFAVALDRLFAGFPFAEAVGENAE